MCATLTPSVREFTRPTYSSIIFGLLPAASIRVGFSINVGMKLACRAFLTASSTLFRWFVLPTNPAALLPKFDESRCLTVDHALRGTEQFAFFHLGE